MDLPFAQMPFGPMIAFAFAMSATPGPNNVMIANAAANHGLRATAPMLAGILAGGPSLFLASGAGLAAPLAASPGLHLALKWIGAAWLLWLAWRIATAPPPPLLAGPAPRPESRPPLGFLGAAAFQWVNPKAWVMVLGALAAFTPVGVDAFGAAAIMAVVFVLVGLPSISFWMLVGLGMRRLLRSARAFRAFNVAMAVLLALSLVPAFLPEVWAALIA